MASEAKTRPTEVSVEAFIAAVEHPGRRADAAALCAMMMEISGQPAVMWGPSIVGFGAYHFRYDSGREGDAPLIGFSPRKAKLVLYLMAGFEGRQDLLARLGKAKTGGGCLYLNRLAEVDQDVLRELIASALDEMKRRYPDQAAAR